MNKREASIYRYTKSGELLGAIECAHVCGDKQVICQADSESIILANVRKAFHHQPDERRDNFVITCVDSPVYTAAGLKGLYNKAKANFSSKEAPYAEIIKLNLKSGYVEWTSDKIVNPTAITKLTDERVLVAGWKQGLRQTNLFIMNTSSGKQRPLRLVWTIIFTSYRLRPNANLFDSALLSSVFSWIGIGTELFLVLSTLRKPCCLVCQLMLSFLLRSYCM